MKDLQSFWIKLLFVSHTVNHITLVPRTVEDSNLSTASLHNTAQWYTAWCSIFCFKHSFLTHEQELNQMFSILSNLHCEVQLTGSGGTCTHTVIRPTDFKSVAFCQFRHRAKILWVRICTLHDQYRNSNVALDFCYRKRFIK